MIVFVAKYLKLEYNSLRGDGMLKQIRFENLYNFKEEIVFDFVVSKDSDEFLVNQFNKDKIANFALLYGKNNVGKSNFIQIVKDIKTLLEEGKCEFQAFRPLTRQSSMFELIFENAMNEIRYGVEFDIDEFSIVDEWMNAKLQGSSRETVIFDRKEEIFNRLFNRGILQAMKSLNDDKLIVSLLSSISDIPEIINEFLAHIKQISILNCLESEEEVMKSGIFHQQMTKLSQDIAGQKLIVELLHSADVDIDSFSVSVFSDEEMEGFDLFLEAMDQMKNKNLTEHDEKEVLNEVFRIVKKYPVHQFVGKPVYGVMGDNNKNVSMFTLEFLHNTSAKFSYNDLSTGTKQIFNIGLLLYDKISSNHTVFLDEIETGLHPELLNVVVTFMSELASVFKENQFIITTHDEKLLDYPFIPDETKMFMKKENQKIFIDYSSNFKYRGNHLQSRRYLLDAYASNPNITYDFRDSIVDVKTNMRNQNGT